MIIIFGLRRLRKGLGPVMVRCSKRRDESSRLVQSLDVVRLVRIPLIPVSFEHFTACGNCKRLEQVSKTQLESARAQGDAVKAASQDGPAGVRSQTATLENTVNQWASVGQAQSVSSESNANPARSPPSYPPASPPPQPPAGWFPDPSGTGTNRYWEGQ